MANAFGIVTSTPRRVNVYGLQQYRPAGAFSFVGRYRIVDFPISNFTNSGIENIQVYLSGNPRSLVDHLGTGRQYNINSKSGRLQLLFCTHNNHNELYNTDISNYIANMDTLRELHQEYVIVTPCYMVFKENFADLLKQHVESGADVTMLYHKVNNAKDHFLFCRVLDVDKDQKATNLQVNGATRQNQNIFMDTYVMKKELFMKLAEAAAAYSSTFSMSQYLALECQKGELDIRGVQHKGYFNAIGDLQAYFDANQDMLDLKKASDLFSEDWTIYTRTSDSCPTKIIEGASVSRSMISNGCLIEGTVENSVIGRGVKIGKGAVVRNSIILAYSEIGKDVTVENEVVDKWAKIVRTKELKSSAAEPGYVKKRDLL